MEGPAHVAFYWCRVIGDRRLKRTGGEDLIITSAIGIAAAGEVQGQGPYYSIG